MNELKKILTVNVTIILVCLVCAYGCTSAEEKRAMLNDEMIQLYNEFIDDITVLSNAEILSKCDRAIEQFSDLAIAYELKGLVLWEQDKLKPALENYKKTLELEPFDDDILVCACEVALQLNGTFIWVDDNGEIMSTPFQKITLERYAGCAEELRFEMCMISLDIDDAVKKKVLTESKSTTHVFVDQQGNEIEDMERITVGVSFEGDPSISELDNWLLQKSRINPESTLGEVLWLFTAEKMNYGQIN